MMKILNRAGWMVCFSLLFMYASAAPGVPKANDTQVLQDSIQSLRATLYVFDYDTYDIVDGTLVDYGSQYSNAVDFDDALKLFNSGVSVSLKRDGSFLAVERRNTMSSKDTLYLNTRSLQVREYRWIIQGINIAAANRVAYMHDNFLHTSTLLNLDGVTAIDFTPDQLSTANLQDRFSIIFENFSVLPVFFRSFTATRDGQHHVRLHWEAEQQDVDHYEIEVSPDGRQYTPVKPVAAGGAGVQPYDEFTADREEQVQYFRIKAVDKTGLVSYSNTSKLLPLVKDDIIILPAAGHGLNIQVKSKVSDFNVMVYNTGGALLLSRVIKNNTMGSTTYIALPLHLRGNIIVRVVTERLEKAEVVFAQ